MTSDSGTDAFLSTGFRSLDNALVHDGLAAGSVVSILAPPHSLGRRVAFNLCSDRPLLYISIGHVGDAQIDAIQAASDISTGDNIRIRSLEIEDAETEAITDILDSELETLPSQMTVLVDTTNPIENLGDREASILIRTIKQYVESEDGIGILYGVETNDAPDGRWFTTSYADAVFRLSQEVSENDIETQLIIDRLPSGQRLRDNDMSRVFSLPLKTDLDLDTSKTLTP